MAIIEAKVIKKFRDKLSKENPKKVYVVNSFYKGTPERIKELQDLGYLEKKKETSLLDGNVSEVIEKVAAELGEEKLQALLAEENAKSKPRKGVIEHIEGLLNQE